MHFGQFSCNFITISGSLMIIIQWLCPYYRKTIQSKEKSHVNNEDSDSMIRNLDKLNALCSILVQFYNLFREFVLMIILQCIFHVLNSYCAIVFFRECAPPIRAQIHGKKNEQKTQRQQQQKTRTMTIKDI